MERLESETGSARAFLTHSCAGALELAAILAGVEAGDEVIMPSFTFVSTANAFVLRGAVPVFVDVRENTLNLDERLIEAAVTPRTRAIVPVHYGGVACAMDEMMALAELHDLVVIEDAAHALPATYRGRALGGIGHLGAISFHETKNVTCGEGGAILVNDPGLAERAETVHDRGTNRAPFFRGEVDRYTWTDIGSSYAPGEVDAAFLWAQLERLEEITAERLRLWSAYHEAFADLEQRGVVRRPVVPDECSHNAHLYYLLVADPSRRDPLLEELERRGVNAIFHYVPLHSSPAGARLGRAVGDLPRTQWASDSVVRLPLWVGMDDSHVERVAHAVHDALEQPPSGGRRGREAAPAATRAELREAERAAPARPGPGDGSAAGPPSGT